MQIKRSEQDRWEISADREREREKIGEREATGLENICDVSVQNNFATGSESQSKPAEASGNSKHFFPQGNVSPWMCAHTVTLNVFFKCQKKELLKKLHLFEMPDAIIIALLNQRQG